MDDRERELIKAAFLEREDLLERGDHTPGDQARLAELVDVLEGDEAARPYWERAAAAGDVNAIDMLMALITENEPDLARMDYNTGMEQREE